MNMTPSQPRLTTRRIRLFGGGTDATEEKRIGPVDDHVLRRGYDRLMYDVLFLR
jgi:hypothetical protein